MLDRDETSYLVNPVAETLKIKSSMVAGKFKLLGKGKLAIRGRLLKFKLLDVPEIYLKQCRTTSVTVLCIFCVFVCII